MRLTQPTFWHTVRFPGLDWFEARLTGALAVATRGLTDVAFPALQAHAQQAADATDQTQESGEHLVYVMATAEALHQAVRAFGAGPPVPNAWPWEHPEVQMRTAFYFVHLMEPDVVPDVCIPLPESEDVPEGTGRLIGQLYFCLAAYDAAKAEVGRRTREHPEVSAAWEVVRHRNPQSPGIAAHAAPAMDYLGRLCTGPSARPLLRAMFRRHLAEAHGVPATPHG
ncbi:MAG TPA: hypothetical protein VK548_07835, partial [Candidatus Acidoferrum sp.]|nr:hypothetical protein [Candidatus Acidoferrum sp.]